MRSEYASQFFQAPQNKDNYIKAKKAASEIFLRKKKMAIKFGTQQWFNELTDEFFNLEEELFGVKKSIGLEKKNKAAAAAGDEDSSDNDEPDELTQFVRRKKHRKGKLCMANYQWDNLKDALRYKSETDDDVDYSIVITIEY